MAKAESVVVHHLSGLLASGSLTGLPDRLLLERFVTQPGEVAEAAFAALVARHGPMVLRVCRAMLPDHQDAQDAFQVTFVLLAAKASRLRDTQLLANWLYGVAMRSALKMRSNSARRWRHERRVAEQTHEAVIPVETDAEDYTALYEEINSLPARYRGPIVLCHLQGLSREMAASLLDCPISTLNVRLMRARNRLKERLTRRQFHLPAGFIGPILGGSTMAPLSAPLTRVAMASITGRTGTLSSSLIALAREIQIAMFMTKLKVCAGLFLTIGVVTAGVGTVARSQTAVERIPSARQELKNTQELHKRGSRAIQKPGFEYRNAVTHLELMSQNKTVNLVGWTWLMTPQELQTGATWGQAHQDDLLSGYSHVDPTDGSLRIYFVEVRRADDLGPEDRRLVVLDALKNRYLPTLVDHRGGLGNERGGNKTHLRHAVYRLDRTELDPSKATYIGVEQIVRKQDKPQDAN